MRLDRLLAERDRTLSLEFFPPKTEKGWLLFEDCVKQLAQLGPDFMTVTYGAGGGTRARTKDAVVGIAEWTGLPTVSHLTCVGATREELRELFDEYHGAGIENLLALRGDPPKGQDDFQPVPGGCVYASELLELIGEDGRFASACAAFPEGHPEAAQREADWGRLIGKFETGACMAMTQLFYDAADYFAMMDWLERTSGARPRVVPGIMPVLSWQWLQDFLPRFCPNARIPDTLRARMEPLADDAVAARREGIAYTIELCRALLAGGAPGLHIYTLDKAMAPAEIVTALRLDGLL